MHENLTLSMALPSFFDLNEYWMDCGLNTRTKKSDVLALALVRFPNGVTVCTELLSIAGAAGGRDLPNEQAACTALWIMDLLQPCRN